MVKSVPKFNLYLLIVLFVCVSINISDARIRYKIRIKPECREKGPRRYEELPNVIFTGFVEQLYPALSDGDDTYNGQIFVKHVLRGPSRLENSRVTVGGFGTQGLCYSNVRKRDTWIFQLTQVSDGFLKLNGTLLKVTLPNLDRLSALVKDEPYRRRPAIIDFPCEIKYCENNANCINEERSGGGVLSRAKCVCLDRCSNFYSPVCGSNGETFTNECEIRLQSCHRGKNYFTRFPNACETGRRSRDVQKEFLTQSVFISQITK